MYQPKHFEMSSAWEDFVRQYSFATLITHSDAVAIANHFPMLLESNVLYGHMARANPQWKSFQNQPEVLLTFQGPHTYISPSWYGPGPQVPTWNYVAVHIYGHAEITSEGETYAILEKMVQKYESGRANPWQLNLPEKEKSEMVRAIVGFKVIPTRIEAKAKLSQNRAPEDRTRVIEALKASESYEDREVAKWMESQK